MEDKVKKENDFDVVLNAIFYICIFCVCGEVKRHHQSTMGL